VCTVTVMVLTGFRSRFSRVGFKVVPGLRVLLNGLKRTEWMVGALAAPAPPTTPATTPPAATEAAPSPTGEPPATPAPAAEPAATAPPAASADPAPAATSGQAAPPPSVEVITAPPPPPPPPEVESGASAVRDVVLEAGVPDLAKGRRPVPPPLARMAGTSGVVEVQFSVSAAGTCL